MTEAGCPSPSGPAGRRHPRGPAPGQEGVRVLGRPERSPPSARLSVSGHPAPPPLHGACSSQPGGFRASHGPLAWSHRPRAVASPPAALCCGAGSVCAPHTRPLCLSGAAPGCSTFWSRPRRCLRVWGLLGTPACFLLSFLTPSCWRDCASHPGFLGHLLWLESFSRPKVCADHPRANCSCPGLQHMAHQRAAGRSADLLITSVPSPHLSPAVAPFPPRSQALGT